MKDLVVFDFSGPSGTRPHVGTATYLSVPTISISSNTSGRFSLRKPYHTWGSGKEDRYVVLRVECH